MPSALALRCALTPRAALELTLALALALVLETAPPCSALDVACDVVVVGGSAAGLSSVGTLAAQGSCAALACTRALAFARARLPVRPTPPHRTKPALCPCLSGQWPPTHGHPHQTNHVPPQAIAAARDNASVCLLEPTDWVGGQMTASGVGF